MLNHVFYCPESSQPSICSPDLTEQSQPHLVDPPSLCPFPKNHGFIPHRPPGKTGFPPSDGDSTRWPTRVLRLALKPPCNYTTRALSFVPKSFSRIGSHRPIKILASNGCPPSNLLDR